MNAEAEKLETQRPLRRTELARRHGGENKNPARLLPREFCAGSLLTNRSSTRAEHLCCAGTRCGLSVVTSINSRGSVFTGGITGLRRGSTSGTDLRVYTCGVSIALRRGSGGGGAAFYLSYRSAISSPGHAHRSHNRCSAPIFISVRESAGLVEVLYGLGLHSSLLYCFAGGGLRPAATLRPG